MIPREILKKNRQIEIRTNRVVTTSSERGCPSRSIFIAEGIRKSSTSVVLADMLRVRHPRSVHFSRRRSSAGYLREAWKTESTAKALSLTAK